MLYVFYVDIGHMLMFDMNLALETVQVLKEAIEIQCGVPHIHQVLLVSGGEILQPMTRVCSYSAGTDTNPIFMFSTSVESSKNVTQPMTNLEKDAEIKEQIELSLNLPATYNTVVTRARLAQEMHDQAKEITKICEKLVHEQHLQQQGWAAVTANMEDLTEEFRQRCNDFYRCFAEHMERRTVYLEFLTHFHMDLNKLAKIPILSSLLDGNSNREFHGFGDYLEDTESFTGPSVVGIPVILSTVTTTTTTTTTLSASTNISTHTTATNVATTVSGGGGGICNNDEMMIETTSQKIRSESPSRSRDDDTRNTKKLRTDDLELSDKQKFRGLSLLQWISSKENRSTLEKLADCCMNGLNMINDAAIDSLKSHVNLAIKRAEQDDVRQIKGLENRLCGLEKLMYDARNIVQEQHELAQSMQHNQNRASHLNDTSILPDLCVSHSQQLRVMLRNHKNLRDIHRRISKAKEELAENLLQRLQYIVCIENRMSELDNKLLFYHRCLRRLQRHLIIIEQIHNAPSIYVTAITEVVRRRKFSNAFLIWATDLANRLLNIYNEEIMRRQDFCSLFDDHFLMILFPGMEDLPSTYGTQAPSIFDASLPSLNENDIEALSTYLSDISLSIEQPDINRILDFFLSRSPASKLNNSNNHNDKNNKINNRQLDENNAASTNENELSIPRPIDLHAHLRDGFESETDTEEFEKVGQSPIERKISSLPTTTTPESTISSMQPQIVNNTIGVNTTKTEKPETQNISTSTETIATHSIETLTEDNLGSTRIELERHKSVILDMYKYSNSLITMVRQRNEDMENLKRAQYEMQNEYENKLEKIINVIQNVKSIEEQNQREIINRLTVDHELELNDLRKLLQSKDEEIQSLKVMNLNLCDRLTVVEEIKIKNDEEIENLHEKLKQHDNEISNRISMKEKEFIEVREKLIREHKTEIESLRSRFKIMTNMVRTPSETSLEKIERPDLLDLGTSGMDSMHGGGGIPIDHRMRFGGGGGIFGSPKSPSSAGPHEFYKRMLDDKERQLDEFREREQLLTRENSEIKKQLQELADSETNAGVCDAMRQHIESLRKDKQRLELEINVQKIKHAEMESSVATIKGMDASTYRSSRTTCAKPCVNIESCTKGDLVVVMWDSEHGQYTIVQETPILYFLHADSHQLLNLPLSGGVSSAMSNTTTTSATTPQSFPKTVYCIGRVIDKEYCHARKDENRYKVSKGTKFYRVKVRPRSPSRNSILINESGSGCGGGGTGGKCKDPDSDKSTIPQQKQQQQHSPEVHSRITHNQILINSFAQTDFSLNPVQEDDNESNTTTILDTRITRDTSTTTLIHTTSNTISSMSLSTTLSSSTEKTTPDMVDSGVDTQQQQLQPQFAIDKVSLTDHDDDEDELFSSIKTASDIIKLDNNSDNQQQQQQQHQINQQHNRYSSVTEDETILDNPTSHCEKMKENFVLHNCKCICGLHWTCLQSHVLCLVIETDLVIININCTIQTLLHKNRTTNWMTIGLNQLSNNNLKLDIQNG